MELMLQVTQLQERHARAHRDVEVRHLSPAARGRALLPPPPPFHNNAPQLQGWDAKCRALEDEITREGARTEALTAGATTAGADGVVARHEAGVAAAAARRAAAERAREVVEADAACAAWGREIGAVIKRLPQLMSSLLVEAASPGQPRSAASPSAALVAAEGDVAAAREAVAELGARVSAALATAAAAEADARTAQAARTAAGDEARAAAASVTECEASLRRLADVARTALDASDATNRRLATAEAAVDAASQRCVRERGALAPARAAYTAAAERYAAATGGRPLPPHLVLPSATAGARHT